MQINEIKCMPMVWKTRPKWISKRNFRGKRLLDIISNLYCIRNITQNKWIKWLRIKLWSIFHYFFIFLTTFIALTMVMIYFEVEIMNFLSFASFFDFGTISWFVSRWGPVPRPARTSWAWRCTRSSCTQPPAGGSGQRWRSSSVSAADPLLSAADEPLQQYKSFEFSRFNRLLHNTGR